VKKARVDQNMTLESLAHAAFDNLVRKGFVSQIERGNRPVSALTAGRLVRALKLPDAVLDLILKNDPVADDAPTPEDEKAAKMIAAAETEGVPGVGESLLVALAYEYAEGDTTDLQSAYKGLRAALETARDMAARAELGDNTDASVAAIRARVDALNAEGDPDAAAEVIDEAIAQKSAEMAAVLDLGVKQDRLRNDPKAAAEKLVMGLRLEVAEDALFGALVALRRMWYAKGRDAGLNFEAAVAIHLAEATLQVARDADERRNAGNGLGIALKLLGERESGTDKLEEAVNAYRATLEDQTRDRAPLDWATTQMNLGTALKTLGERVSGTDRLEEAVKAYRAALEEQTRDRAPLDWAMTQMNLGNALKTLGARESCTDRLEQAVNAHRAALEERTRDRAPLDWAMTQMNLGNALQTLGERESGTERLEEAVVAFRSALEECKRNRVPLEWAKTQMNLGNVLQIIGARESGIVKLEEAVVAYRAALEERTRDRVPLNWAQVQGNLALLESTMFDKDAVATRLDVAEGYAREALAVFVDAEASFYVEWVEGVLTAILERRDALT